MSEPRQVVGAAILRQGPRGIEVLAAQRVDPPEVAGQWEFPGGKIEPGETPDDAVRRETAEELEVEIEVVGWLDGETAPRADLRLRVATARLVAGEPHPHEHAAIRWVRLDDLDSVPWLASDVPFLEQLRKLA